MFEKSRMLSTIAKCAAGFVLVAASIATGGQSGPVQKTSTAQNAEQAKELNWWKNAVIYEVYPRSFQDTNGDGIGDLAGITKRLDYLSALGVDAIWLTPVYPSPQVDFGYDISNYEDIDPQYGTLADFDRLVSEANKRHIRVLMDMVMNHTSDQHEWFLQSRSSRDNPYRDWYCWHDPSASSGQAPGQTATDKGAPPNNWQSLFGHSAWQWDEKTRQYYYHKFYVQQPDLNWHNPAVHEAFKEIIAFWLKRGVGGFRFDAITTLFEDPSLADEGVRLGKDGKPVMNAFGDPQLDGSKTDNQPGLHEVMQEMRAEADKFDLSEFPGTRVLIGETYLPNIGELKKMYGTPDKPEFQLPMDTQVGMINKLDVTAFRQKLIDAETHLGAHIPAAPLRQSRQPADRRALRRRRTRRGHSARDRDDFAGQPRRGPGLLRRRDRNEDDAAHAQAGREGPDRNHRLAEGEGPRWRAHSNAVGRNRKCRIHHWRAVAARTIERGRNQRAGRIERSQFAARLVPGRLSGSRRRFRPSRTARISCSTRKTPRC
jgi:hypothetical protein